MIRTPLSKSKGQLVADVLKSQHAGTGATWRINAKILSTCRGRRHIVSPRIQLVFIAFIVLYISVQRHCKQVVGGRPPWYAPPSPRLLPPWAPRLAPPSRRQRSSSFSRPTRSHADRCSRLTRQHGGEQSGLVTLTTFWPWKWCRVTCDVGYLCANFGLPMV